MKTYWYECQERAMAPGVADGWPKIIPAPHTPNGRLVRQESPTPNEVAAVAARGVERGIEMVRHQIHEMRLHKSTDAEDACDRALAAFRAEAEGGVA
jgi:hypothetical protein